jgi:hypothetical protein
MITRWTRLVFLLGLAAVGGAIGYTRPAAATLYLRCPPSYCLSLVWDHQITDYQYAHKKAGLGCIRDDGLRMTSYGYPADAGIPAGTCTDF